MDAQDYRSLQEAYLDVYESSIGDRARNVVANDRLDDEQTGTNTSMDRLRNQSKKFNITRASASSAAKKVEGDVMKSNTYGPQRPKPGTVSGRRIEEPKPTGSKASGHKIEQVNFYDIILSHLLDEGYAETIESAEAIMVNMSEDWRYDILEEVLDEENERGQRRAAARNMIDRHRTMTKGVSPEDRTGPEGYLRHRAKTERPTTLRNTSSAGQRRAAARNAIDRSATMSKGVSPEDRTGPEGYLRHRAKTGG